MNGTVQATDMRTRFADLAGKVAIVTGGGRGIGRGIAEFLAGQGMKLVLAGIDGQEGEATAAGLRRNGAECAWVTADLVQPGDAQRAFDAAVGPYGRIDVLVNNAAQLRSKPFLELDEEAYRSSFEGNARIVYNLSWLVARRMAEAKSGSIINISSVGGSRAHHHLAGYDAYKGAVDALTRSMALNLAQHGVRVNAVAPGAILSHPEDPSRGAWAKGREQHIPLRRLGRPADIAAVVAFLASDAASYITGQVLYVDGGLTAQLTPPGIFV